MKMKVFKMEITGAEKNDFMIRINDDKEEAFLKFDPNKKELQFINENDLISYLKVNEYQLRTMLHNKRADTYYPGFKLKFVLREDKDVAGFNDRSKIVVLDKRNNGYQSYVIDEKEAKEKIHIIYTDASYLEKKNSGGMAVIIADPDNDYQLYAEPFHGEGSSQAELAAAARALELLKDIREIRIITDSQYVRKGLTEWLPLWKINGFRTINGEPAKNIDNWLSVDRACNEKYIELQWVKGHSDHFENSLCDLYAREAAKLPDYRS